MKQHALITRENKRRTKEQKLECQGLFIWWQNMCSLYAVCANEYSGRNENQNKSKKEKYEMCIWIMSSRIHGWVLVWAVETDIHVLPQHSAGQAELLQMIIWYKKQQQFNGHWSAAQLNDGALIRLFSINGTSQDLSESRLECGGWSWWPELLAIT